MRRTALPPRWIAHPDLVSSGDFDEIVELARAASHDLDARLERTPETLRLDVWRRQLGAVSIGCTALDCNAPLDVSAPPLDHYHLQVPVRGSSMIACQGSSIHTGARRCALMLSPGMAAAWKTTAGFAEVQVNVEANRLHHHLEMMMGTSVNEHVSFHPEVNLQTRDGASLTSLLHYMIDESCAANSDAELGSLEPLILEAILLQCPHSHSKYVAGSDAHFALAHRATQVLHANPECAIDELAFMVRVSTRTLQVAFRRALACSPGGFAKARRLDAARDDLLTASAHDSVTGIALRHGHGHLGRFSAAYMARFGELPSSTLRGAQSESRRLAQFG